MIIQLHEAVSPIEENRIKEQIISSGFVLNEVVTEKQRYLVCTGSKSVDIRLFGNMQGVRDVHFVSDANPLVSREWKVGETVIDLGDGIKIGAGQLALMAGPCSIESEEQVQRTVDFLVSQDVRIMRGGVFKPRSSPYAFRGMGIDGLKFFYKTCKEKGIRIITEIMQADQLELMHDYVDIFQVGARNSQNFTLLDALGKCGKAVLIKRGLSGTIDELLASAEYVFSGGNEQILLCERGIRSFEKSYRNTLDLNAIPILKSRSHLPVIVDPSHGIGLRQFVAPMALAAVMAGADGLLLEIHEEPEKAASDGQQTLNFTESASLFAKLKQAQLLLNSFE
jgi:3-deoxy-7-phosphoheptulonate synthase